MDGVLPRHQVAEFERLLPAYARLQASTVDSVDELLANGVPDHRADRLPALVEPFMADVNPAV